MYLVSYQVDDIDMLKGSHLSNEKPVSLYVSEDLLWTVQSILVCFGGRVNLSVVHAKTHISTAAIGIFLHRQDTFTSMHTDN